jgi:hypothetical protein
MPHWNDQLPGKERSWSRLYRVDKLGSHVGKHCKPASGVYRLIGLKDKTDVPEPATIDRICGRDQTGTLYIGSADRSLQRRLQQLSLTLRRGRRGGHGAAGLLRSNSLLWKKFPSNRLAITWYYTEPYLVAEHHLIVAYTDSFGEGPPLNLQGATIFSFLDPEVEEEWGLKSGGG